MRTQKGFNFELNPFCDINISMQFTNRALTKVQPDVPCFYLRDFIRSLNLSTSLRTMKRSEV